MFEEIKRFFQRNREPRIPSDPSDRLYEWEKKALLKAKCPDCGEGLLEGSQAGRNMNVKCVDCGHKFNISHLAVGEMMGHRLTKVT